MAVNVNDSMPVGIYHVEKSGREPVKGDIVQLCADPRVVAVARERDYLPCGSCPFETAPMMKIVAVLAGDLVDVTSGATVRALDVDALRIGPQIEPGVPWTVTVGPQPFALALKSGNFDSEDFFARAGHGAMSAARERGEHVEGDRPTKEAALHLAVYQARPSARAIVHLHAPYSVALSCLCHADDGDVLPKLTPYAVMRIGALPLVPYAPPGARALAEAVGRHAATHHAVLLANHGPVVAGTSLDAAVATSEELEEVARLSFLLHGRAVRSLTESEIDTLIAAHRIG